MALSYCMNCWGDRVQSGQKLKFLNNYFLHLWLDPWIFAGVQTHTFGRYTPILNFLAAGIIEQYDKQKQLSFFCPNYTCFYWIRLGWHNFIWKSDSIWCQILHHMRSDCIAITMQAIQKLCRGVHDKGMNEKQHDYCI